MKRKAMAGAAAILLGACMLIIGLLNLRFPAFGANFLQAMGSVFPGFHDSRTIGEVIVGTFYGVVDGAILGYIFSSLYRWAGGTGASEVKRIPQPTVVDPTLRRAS